MKFHFLCLNITTTLYLEKMESSPYDEEYKIDDGDDTSQVDLYTPSPRGQLKKS